MKPTNIRLRREEDTIMTKQNEIAEQKIDKENREAVRVEDAASGTERDGPVQDNAATEELDGIAKGLAADREDMFTSIRSVIPNGPRQ